MTISLGLFDIMQIDPTDPAEHGDVFRRRLDDWAYADEIGLELGLTAERHFMPHYRSSTPSVWIAAASQRTRQMRLGVMAYTLPLHSPVLLAEEIAALDQLSGGRMEVGIGLGHRPEELFAVGVTPEKRIPIFQERLALLQALWTGGQVSVESEHNIVRNVAINPTPFQQPHPPLWYAGANPDAAHWAGGFGMSLAIGFAPLRNLIPTAAAFRAGRRDLAEAAGSDGLAPHQGRIALMRHIYLAESDERAKAEMTDDLLRLHELGKAHDEGGRADRRAKAAEEADALIRDEVYLAGSPESVARAIGFANQTLGVNVLIGNPYGAGIEDERIRRTLRLLATEVRAALTVPEIAATTVSD